MIDEGHVALDVARRFTQDDEPQRRAQLQVAVVEAIRAGQAPFPLVALLEVPKFCDMAAGLQDQVQQLIDDHRRTYPEERK